MKSLKQYIYEGAWGYDPQDNDSVLDRRSMLIGGCLEYIYDECFKRIWSNSEGIDINGNSAWEAIGTIEYFFEKMTAFDECYNKDKDKEYDKYYYWWKLKDGKKKDILDLYSRAIEICAEDENFINSWKEPEDMIKSLKKRADILKKYAKLRDEYFKHNLDLEKQRVNATVDCIKNPGKKIVVYGKEPGGKNITWHTKNVVAGEIKG